MRSAFGGGAMFAVHLLPERHRYRLALAVSMRRKLCVLALLQESSFCETIGIIQQNYLILSYPFFGQQSIILR